MNSRNGNLPERIAAWYLIHARGFYCPLADTSSKRICARSRLLLDHPALHLVSRTFIVDVASETDLPVRLYGTRLVEVYGEFTHHNYLDMVSPELRKQVGRAHQQMCSVPCGWITSQKAVTTYGRQVTIEYVSLPLVNRGRICCVAKLAYATDTLELREAFGVPLNVVSPSLDRQNSRWIDVGAGIPD